MSPRLRLELERDAYAPGDVVPGRVVVEEGGRSRAVEVFLEYHERSDDYARVAVSVGSGPVHTGELTAGESYPFEVKLPDDALPAYRSRHGELYWEVDARSDEFGRDTHARRRIDVSPTR